MGLAYELVTTDEDGRPRIAMLSHGEILVINGEMRIALWPASTTSVNLSNGQPYLLSVIVPDAVWYLLGSAQRLGGDSPLACFRLTADEVRSDRHAGFPVVGPIAFRLERAVDEVVAEWQAQHDMIRNAAAS